MNKTMSFWFLLNLIINKIKLIYGTFCCHNYKFRILCIVLNWRLVCVVLCVLWYVNLMNMLRILKLGMCFLWFKLPFSPYRSLSFSIIILHCFPLSFPSLYFLCFVLSDFIELFIFAFFFITMVYFTEWTRTLHKSLNSKYYVN